MLRIFSTIIVLAALCFIVVVIVGYNSNPNYEKTMSALYFDKPEVVWSVLNDIENYPSSKIDVKQVEILERDFNVVSKWREIISDTESREYEVLEKSNSTKLVLKMRNTKTGLEGVWTYSISLVGDKSKLVIEEKSILEDSLRRGLITILGRERNINYEFKWLRVKLFEDLING